MANRNNQQARTARLLKETIKALVLEERVNNLLENVRLDEEDIFELYEGRWDGIKHKLAAAGLAIACTATGCAPVMQNTGQPVDPAELADMGLDMDDLKPGESGVDYDDTGSPSDQHKRPDEPPPTALGGAARRNTAGGMGRNSLR